MIVQHCISSLIGRCTFHVTWYTRCHINSHFLRHVCSQRDPHTIPSIMIKLLLATALALSLILCHASEVVEHSPPPPPSPFAPTPMPMDVRFYEPSAEELGVNVPSNPILFGGSFDISVDIYRLELATEAYFEGHQYEVVSEMLQALKMINHHIYPRLAKKIMEKSIPMRGMSEEMPKHLHNIADQMETDQDINSLIEVDGLEPAIRSKLLSKLSAEGTLIRHVRDVNLEALKELIERGDKASQQDVDAAFEEAVREYQKTAHGTRVDVVKKGVMLEWLAGRASEKARKSIHPHITSYTSFLIDRGVKSAK